MSRRERGPSIALYLLQRLVTEGRDNEWRKGGVYDSKNLLCEVSGCDVLCDKAIGESSLFFRPSVHGLFSVLFVSSHNYEYSSTLIHQPCFEYFFSF